MFTSTLTEHLTHLHQNHTTILCHFNYVNNSFIVLITDEKVDQGTPEVYPVLKESALLQLKTYTCDQCDQIGRFIGLWTTF